MSSEHGSSYTIRQICLFCLFVLRFTAQTQNYKRRYIQIGENKHGCAEGVTAAMAESQEG